MSPRIRVPGAGAGGVQGHRSRSRVSLHGPGRRPRITTGGGVRLIHLLVCRLTSQDTARENAAQAAALLQDRRDERDHVEAYLVRRRS